MFKDSPAFSSYSVQDSAATKNFYQDLLGSTLSEDAMLGLQLKFPNGHSVYLYQKDDHVPATFTVLNLPVESIDRAVTELAAKGIKMEHYDSLPVPQDESGISRGKAAGMGPDIAWFKDPSGNILGVLEA